jgi:hypothetical protein
MVIWVWSEDSVGETPTDASETVALPRKSLMIGDWHVVQSS